MAGTLLCIFSVLSSGTLSSCSGSSPSGSGVALGSSVVSGMLPVCERCGRLVNSTAAVADSVISGSAVWSSVCEGLLAWMSSGWPWFWDVVAGSSAGAGSSAVSSMLIHSVNSVAH